MENLNDRIVKKLNSIRANATKSQLKRYHIKSTENFIYHLIEKENNFCPEETMIYKDIEEDIKLGLLQYLHLIEGNNICIQTGADNFLEYIGPIGHFMIKHYGFTHAGGIFRYYYIRNWMLPVLIIEAILFFKGFLPIPVFSFLTLLFLIIRIYIKVKQRRVFGLWY